MMTIGEMYRRSGGVSLHKSSENGPSQTSSCGDCRFFSKGSEIFKTVDGKVVNRGKCTRHSDDNQWRSNYIACKYFR